MLRIHMSGSVGAAKSYYCQGLDKGGDYYTGEGLPGIWSGRAAAKLGLSGEITEEQFHMLCDNLRPDTGEKLNPRAGRDRRLGYDFVFSAPKSISVLFGVIGDRRILEGFNRAVDQTMRDIEADAHVRVRKGGADRDRNSKNLIWGKFTHEYSRPTDERSAPDPNLHAHCYAFNTSWDPVEKIFKAGQFFQIKRDAPYFESLFHSRLATEMQRLGYGIANRPFSFEVRGVGQENIDRFSKRAKEIEAVAEELGIAGNARAKDGLAAKTRKRKSSDLTREEIRRDWLARLDRDSLSYHQLPAEAPGKKSPEQAIDYAMAMSFERNSVVPQRRVLTAALQFSTGDCTPQELRMEIGLRDEIVTGEHQDQLCITTKAIIAQEKGVLEILESSAGSFSAMNPTYRSGSKDEDQRDAIKALVRSRDQVFVIEGRAGTGKTTLMREAVAAMGGRVFTFAPTSEAAHKVLKGDGFEDSETVQQLLVNSELQSGMEGATMWVDEAGLLSVGEILNLLRIARRRKARLVLSGCTHQHHAVDRGDGLRLVVRSGLVEVVQTRSVYRQRGANYRRAVEAISAGRLIQGVEILDGMGAIREHPDLGARCEAIARAYLEAPESLVVSPTHLEAEQATAEIRRQLRAAGKLGNEIECPALRSRNFTEAERGQALFLKVGDVVKFHQNAQGGITKGDQLKIEHIGGDGRVWLDRGNSLGQLDLNLAGRYQVYGEFALPVALGDKLRLTQNVTIGEKKLYNGSTHRVRGFQNNRPVIDGGHKLPQGCFAHGYVATSHSSQGKTRDRVIISQSSLSAGAASMAQLYVSVSRARDGVTIFTDSKEDLVRHTQRSETRLLAIELEEGENLETERRNRRSLKQRKFELGQTNEKR